MALVVLPPSLQTVFHELQIIRNWGPVGGMVMSIRMQWPRVSAEYVMQHQQISIKTTS
jgi:hypothetical protein